MAYRALYERVVDWFLGGGLGLSLGAFLVGTPPEQDLTINLDVAGATPDEVLFLAVGIHSYY